MKIAVCIPSHSHYIQYIDRVLKSIVNQTRRPDLVVFSLSEVQSEVEKDLIPNLPFRAEVYITDKVKNMAENRNICAKNLPKDIDVVSFFDIDDYMHPRRLEFVEKAFTEGFADVFIHGYEKIDYVQKPDEYWDKISKEMDAEYGVIEQDEIFGHVGHLSVRKNLFDSFNFLETNDLKFSSDMEYVKETQKRALKLLQCSAKLCLYLYRCPRINALPS